MNTRIKSAFDKIKAEDELIQKTEMFLRKAMDESKTENVIQFKRKSFSPVKKMIATAACFVILLSAGTVGYTAYKTPVAYVSLDINPSVEIGINTFKVVCYAQSYNDDGSKILNDTHVFNKDIRTAISNLIDSASENGFIADDGSTVISITSETDNLNIVNSLQDEAIQGANAAIQENNDTAVVVKDNVALSKRNDAKKAGVTPGKYNLIQKIIELDPTASVDQYKDAKVTDIMSKVKELKQKSNVIDKGNKSTHPGKQPNTNKVTPNNTKKNDMGNNKTSNSQKKNNQNTSSNGKTKTNVKPTLKPKNNTENKSNGKNDKNQSGNSGDKGNGKNKNPKIGVTPSPTPTLTQTPTPTPTNNGKGNKGDNGNNGKDKPDKTK